MARGRVDLHAPDHERGWRRLRTISGIGPWTIEMLALQGQARYDQVAAGDLGYIKVCGTLFTGRPKARAEIDDVRAFFERYGEWKGLAGEYLIASRPRAAGCPRASASSRRGSAARRCWPRAPGPAGTRW